MALIRYPGSKAKLAKAIRNKFPAEVWGAVFQDGDPWEYREPFFGAGAIGFDFLRRLDYRAKVTLNDRDPGIAALWQTVAWDPWTLCKRIDATKPTPELFYELKEEDGRSDLPRYEIAVRKLTLHRLSFSGLGYMSGGPLGGKDQSSAYNVDCRWNPEVMKQEINKLHKLLKRFSDLNITNTDFRTALQGVGDRCFVYLDPPYYEKGPQLYKHSMDHEDHVVLAMKVRNLPGAWALSYDDHPEIRRLYSWATIAPIEFKYTMARAKDSSRPKNQEVVITP